MTFEPLLQNKKMHFEIFILQNVFFEFGFDRVSATVYVSIRTSGMFVIIHSDYNTTVEDAYIYIYIYIIYIYIYIRDATSPRFLESESSPSPHVSSPSPSPSPDA